MDPVQNSATSSFRDLHERAGYTSNQVASATGVNSSTVWKWVRGSRPRLGAIRGLAELYNNKFPVTIEDLILATWGERLEGDLCPCGCGGEKVLPDNEQAQCLYIGLRCKGPCNEMRLYNPSEKHSIFCFDCRKKVEAREYSKPSTILPDRTTAEIARELGVEARRVKQWEKGEGLPHWKSLLTINQRLPSYGDELIKRFAKFIRPVFGTLRTLDRPGRFRFGCIGHDDHRANGLHGAGCRRDFTLTSGQLYWRRWKTDFRSEDTANSDRWQRAFWDPETGRCRCRSCSQASFGILQVEKSIKEVSGARIESRGERKNITAGWSDLFKNLKPTKKGEKRRSTKIQRPWTPEARRNHTIAQIVRCWSKPHYNWSLCRFCQCIIVSDDYSRLPRFCLDHRWQSSLSRRGRRVRDEDLRRYVQWCVLHYLGGKSYRTIAQGNGGLHWTTVEENVRYIVERLQPTKINSLFRRAAELILENAEIQQLNKEALKNNPNILANSPYTRR